MLITLQINVLYALYSERSLPFNERVNANVIQHLLL